MGKLGKSGGGGGGGGWKKKWENSLVERKKRTTKIAQPAHSKLFEIVENYFSHQNKPLYIFLPMQIYLKLLITFKNTSLYIVPRKEV